MVIAELEPKEVWEHFQTLCDIPRPSKHEEQVRDYLKGWADLQGLATFMDAVGNLIIRKPATPGMENRAGVVFQSHLDMVCQANVGTSHDFFKDPIRPVLKEGWLVAENTTLGADNGIGVAFAMAVLASQDIAHGPIEALFTLDEEQGMGGALGLESGQLQGQFMLNLDTEEWGQFFMGCAGGIDVNIERRFATRAAPADYQGVKLSVTGLRGGHSGADIHLGRGNANKILLRVLDTLMHATDLCVASLSGGTARNALSREAFAVFACPQTDEACVVSLLDSLQQTLRDELAGIDDDVTLSYHPDEVSSVLASEDQQAILCALHAAPHGVRAMSQRVPGVVETSNNLGVMRIEGGQLSCNFMVRSLNNSGTMMLANEIISLFTLIHADISTEGGYPGWAPNPSSPLLALCRQTYQREFNDESQVHVIHAGLECGIIGDKYPQMDMVSFGPTIRGAHVPGERVEVASVGHCWTLIKAILADIPTA